MKNSTFKMHFKMKGWKKFIGMLEIREASVHRCWGSILLKDFNANF